ncbi:MAG: MgtC/SapB family protein [Vampirovibrionales bacterium]|nr:MgtC/SapB family protein [Vampirovibrionales bacterium]
MAETSSTMATFVGLSVPTAEALIRLGLAFALGALVGLERELSRHSAGLRTHILVCLGSAVFTILSIDSLVGGETAAMSAPFLLDGGEMAVRLVRDPARIAAQVVTGIGFIGGGVVLRHGATVRGLTTAASLWMVASIGMLVGSGHYVLSMASTALALLTLFVLGKVGKVFSNKHQLVYNRLKLTVSLEPGSLHVLQEWVDGQFRGRVLEIKTTTTASGFLSLHYVVDVTGFELAMPHLQETLESVSGVKQSGLKLYIGEDDA